MATREDILLDIDDEREAQERKWGQQNHPDGTGLPGDEAIAIVARDACNSEHRAGLGTWRSILREEVFEAFAESDPTALRVELIQVAAVAVAWAEAIDRRVS